MKNPEQSFLLGELNSLSWYKVKPADPKPPVEVVRARKLSKAWERSVEKRNESARNKYERKLSDIRSIIYIEKNYKKALGEIRSIRRES